MEHWSWSYDSFRNGTGGGRQRIMLLALNPEAPAIEKQIHHGRRVEREQLASNEAADDGDSQRTPQLRSDAGAERQRQGAEDGCHGGHEDGPETEHAGFEN